MWQETRIFQSTLPVWGATSPHGGEGPVRSISIHAPRVGSDLGAVSAWAVPRNFNPRSPCGERPPTAASGSPGRYFNPRSPCGERLGDTRPGRRYRYFNPRSPCGERRASIAPRRVAPWAFQSTLPVWGATTFSNAVTFQQRTFQSTLPVWGATRPGRGTVLHGAISIHAPRVGSDIALFLLSPTQGLFQSTLPVWGATKRGAPGEQAGDISIHAPRVGSDRWRPVWTPWRAYFNPRSPCGERPIDQFFAASGLIFQSTLPVWGATDSSRRTHTTIGISIHAPRVGSDRIRPLRR